MSNNNSNNNNGNSNSNIIADLDNMSIQQFRELLIRLLAERDSDNGHHCQCCSLRLNGPRGFGLNRRTTNGERPLTPQNVNTIATGVSEDGIQQRLRDQNNGNRDNHKPKGKASTKAHLTTACREFLETDTSYTGDRTVEGLEEECERRYKTTYYAAKVFRRFHLDNDGTFRWNDLGAADKRRYCVMFEAVLQKIGQPVLPLNRSSDFWSTSALLSDVIRFNSDRTTNRTQATQEEASMPTDESAAGPSTAPTDNSASESTAGPSTAPPHDNGFQASFSYLDFLNGVNDGVHENDESAEIGSHNGRTDGSTLESASSTSLDVPDDSVDQLDTQETPASRKRRHIASGIDPSNITTSSRTRHRQE